MTNEQKNLCLAIDDSSIGLSKNLCRALIKQIGGEHEFIAFFNGEHVEIGESTYGFSGAPAVAFYHQHKSELLSSLARHAQKKGMSCGFDYIDKQMSAHFFNRDATAAALHEAESNNPSTEHSIATGIIVQLAMNTLVDRYNALQKANTSKA